MTAKNRITYVEQGGVAQQWDIMPIMRTSRFTQSYARTGADNPLYKSTINRGADATNSLAVSVQNVHFDPGELRAVWQSKTVNRHRLGKVIKTTWLNNVVPNSHSKLPDVWFADSVSNAALIGIIKKIRKFETSDFAGPTFVGELRETLSMLRSPLKALRLKTGLFTDLSMRILRDKQARGGRFKPDPWGKVLSDTYLEWTFGAAPLIADISAIVELFIEKRTRAFGKGLKRLSYRFTDDYNKSMAALTGTWEGTDVVLPINQVEHVRCSRQYVVWIDQDLFFADDALDWLSSASKFDLGEIIPTAWELMPWSFLIDYWTNIGDVMGCSFDFNRNVAIAKLTGFDTVTMYYVPNEPKSTFARAWTVKPLTYTSQNTTVTRNKVSRLGFPQLDVSLPSLGQFQNMAALMRSLQNNNPFRGHTLK